MKLSKKKNMLKLNDYIKQMFNENKYSEIIDEFADIDEIHDLVIFKISFSDFVFLK